MAARASDGPKGIRWPQEPQMASMALDGLKGFRWPQGLQMVSRAFGCPQGPQATPRRQEDPEGPRSQEEPGKTKKHNNSFFLKPPCDSLKTASLNI